jgi:hypothetical protein
MPNVTAPAADFGGLTWVRDVDGLAGAPLAHVDTTRIATLPFPKVSRRHEDLVDGLPTDPAAKVVPTAFGRLGDVELEEAENRAVRFLRERDVRDSSLGNLGSVAIVHAADGERYLAPLGRQHSDGRNTWFTFEGTPIDRYVKQSGPYLPHHGWVRSRWSTAQPQVEAVVGMDPWLRAPTVVDLAYGSHTAKPFGG